MKIINNHKKYSILETSPDDLAAQLTLIDLPIFKSIQREELINLASSKSANTTSSQSQDKLNKSPNVVAMNRQFNQVTFWVVGQILSHESARFRAELISYFIKTAKRLNQLNNLHSSYAIVSALLSTPIYRLEKSWLIVKKKFSKDRIQFEQLIDLYSDNNNYELLRKHLNTSNLPCIPYLGLYSRDLIYINEVYHSSSSSSTSSSSSSSAAAAAAGSLCNYENLLEKRDLSRDKILKIIEKFQESQYDHLVYIPTITNCLLTNRYLDELQKFVEDENYRRSLELEPAPVTHIIDINISNTQQILIDNNNHQLHNNNNNNNHNGNTRQQKRSTMLLAGLTSMVQSAVLTTSNKFVGSSSPRRRSSSSDSQKVYTKYFIDDSSFVNGNQCDNIDQQQQQTTANNHTTLPPPISTSN